MHSLSALHNKLQSPEPSVCTELYRGKALWFVAKLHSHFFLFDNNKPLHVCLNPLFGWQPISKNIRSGESVKSRVKGPCLHPHPPRFLSGLNFQRSCGPDPTTFRLCFQRNNIYAQTHWAKKLDPLPGIFKLFSDPAEWLKQIKEKKTLGDREQAIKDWVGKKKKKKRLFSTQRRPFLLSFLLCEVSWPVPQKPLNLEAHLDAPIEQHPGLTSSNQEAQRSVGRRVPG